MVPALSVRERGRVRVTAIAGLVGLDGRPSAAGDLRGALDILAPFGGAGEGAWAGRVQAMGAALGAVRRRRVPEDDADAQPVVLAGGQVVVVADAVLTNRPELCRALGLPDSAELADPELVAHAYLRWGEGCCERLGGEFAVAVADARRGGVLLARDHTGVRPLFTHRGRGWLGFASTDLAVTGFAGVAAELDVERAKEFLLLLTSERSWVRDVAPVPPATALWVTPDGVRSRRYWELRFDAGRGGSAAGHAEELRAALGEAVRSRLRRRRGRVGAKVSGGLDSTAVVACAAEQLAPEPVHTYTSVPAPGWQPPPMRRDPDESRLVWALAERHPNLVPAFLHTLGERVFGAEDDLYAAGSGPALNPTNMTWIRAIHRRAAAEGVTLLLGGQMGNAAFSLDDPTWLLALLAAGRPGEAWREARDWAATHATTPGRVLARGVLGPLAPTWLRQRRSGRAHSAASWVASTGLRPELATEARLRRRLERRVRRVGRSPRSRARFMADYRATTSATPAAFEAVWGWRQADPTRDVRLLEVVARQPAWARRHRGYDRAAARAAMAGLVPDDIRLRRVRGAQAPDWLDRLADAHAELRAELAAARAHPPTRELVDVERLDALVGDWPPPERAADLAVMVTHQRVLPRALAVSDYLRWFDAWARERPRPDWPSRSGLSDEAVSVSR